MSGVNAHLLVSAPDEAAETASAQALPLVKARFWAGAFQHMLLHPSQQQPGQYRYKLYQTQQMMDASYAAGRTTSRRACND